MSSRWTITDEFGNVRLGDADLPGIFTSLEISQDVEIDEQEVKGRSGKSKQIVGYGDAKVSLTLTLTSDDDTTCYEKLEKIQAKFRATDSAARPEVMNIYNVHVTARGVEKVIFKSFNSSEALGDVITVSLEFEEYIPFVPVSKEDRAETPTTMRPNESPSEPPKRTSWDGGETKDSSAQSVGGGSRSSGSQASQSGASKRKGSRSFGTSDKVQDKTSATPAKDHPPRRGGPNGLG